MSRRSAAVLGSIDTAMSVPSRDALTVTQRLPPRCIRDHGRADRHTVLLCDEGGGDVVRRGRDRRHWLIGRVQAQQRIGRRFGLAPYVQVGVEYHDRGPEWMQLPSWIDECAGDGRTQSPRSPGGLAWRAGAVRQP